MLHGRFVFQQFLKRAFPVIGLVQRGVSLVMALALVHQNHHACGCPEEEGEKGVWLNVSTKAEVYGAAQFHSTFPCN